MTPFKPEKPFEPQHLTTTNWFEVVLNVSEGVSFGVGKTQECVTTLSHISGVQSKFSFHFGHPQPPFSLLFTAGMHLDSQPLPEHGH